MLLLLDIKVNHRVRASCGVIAYSFDFIDVLRINVYNVF